MNECLNNEPNYITYYNSIQMCLPLGLGYEITPTDELLSFLEAIKGVDLSKYMVRKETRGRKGHNRIDLLRAELFAYMKLGPRVIKEDMGFTRFRRRGMKGVTMEFLLVCLGYNLKKYHMYRLRQEKKNALKA